jgi:preprotein translocase subunit SecA
MRRLEKEVMLITLDNHWKEHLAAMDYLRQGIHLRGFAQKNPKQEYKREAFEMFSTMLENIKHEVIGILSKFQIQEPPELRPEARDDADFQFQHEEFRGFGESGEEAAPPDDETHGLGAEKKPFVRPDRKIGRNEPCPCGSGKKYKQCHGRLQ